MVEHPTLVKLRVPRRFLNVLQRALQDRPAAAAPSTIHRRLAATLLGASPSGQVDMYLTLPAAEARYLCTVLDDYLAGKLHAVPQLSGYRRTAGHLRRLLALYRLLPEPVN
jgi:hypothetical protein